MSYSCRAVDELRVTPTVSCLCLSDERGAPALLFQVRWPAGQDELGSRGQPDPGSLAGSRGSHPAEGLYFCERGDTFVESVQEHERNSNLSDLLFIVLNPPVFVFYIVFFRAGRCISSMMESQSTCLSGCRHWCVFTKINTKKHVCINMYLKLQN